MPHFDSFSFNDKKTAITSLKIDGREFVCTDSLLPLFNISLRSSNASVITVNAFDASSVTETRLDDDIRTLIFEKFTSADISVKVFLTIKEKLSWRIQVKNNTKDCIEWVDFPQIAVPNELKGYGKDCEILWGFNEGVIIDTFEKRKISGFPYEEPKYPSKGLYSIFPGGVETQFLAYYGSNKGLYFAAHDNKGNVKLVDFNPEGSGIKLHFRHYSGISAGQDYALEYDMIMQAFEGDWHDACEIYRNWFDQSKAPEFVKIKQNPLIPGWYEKSPVVITYPVRGKHDIDEMSPNKMFPYINAMPKIEQLAKELDSTVMVLLMHWEGTAPWAPPFVWPPYGGEDALREYIDALHEKGHFIGLYCSGLGWTDKSNLVDYNTKEIFEKENLSGIMCLSPEGKLELSNICNDQRVGYDMCPSQKYTKDVIAGETKKMASSGIDYIQILDQNHGGQPYFCYSKNHGHPDVPGKWQADEMKNLLENLKQHTHKDGKKILIGCESAAAETYIPNLLFSDNRFPLNYALGTPVPAYSYIYHEYLNNFSGNQVCANYIFDHVKNPENILLRAAHSFICGDMLMLIINDNGDVVWNWSEREEVLLPERSSIIELIKNLNAWRSGIGKDYLFDGRMIKPFDIKMPEPDVYTLKSGHEFLAEKLLTSRFLSQDGKTGQFIVNYHPYEVECELLFDAQVDYNFYDTPKSNAAGKDRGKEVKLTLKPLSAILIELN